MSHQACREANWFAFAFLMPEEEFKEKYQKLKGNFWALSEHFGVTRQHTHLRAKMLGLIKEETNE